MSARLTHAARACIRNTIVEKVFEVAEAAQRRSEAEVFTRYFDEVQGEHKAALLAVPTAYLNTTQYIIAQARTDSHVEAVYIRGGPGVERPCTTAQIYIDRSTEVSTEVRALIGHAALNRYHLDKDKADVRRRVHDVLCHFTRYASLYKAWPELAQIVPPPSCAAVTNSGGKPPPVRSLIDELNVALSLRMKEAA